MKAMTDLGITIILDERLDLSSVAHAGTKGAERVVRTLKGREISAELIVSTSFFPHQPAPPLFLTTPFTNPSTPTNSYDSPH